MREFLKRPLFALVVMCTLLNFESLAQRKVQQKIPDKTRILFLLDGSGSMMGQWVDGKSRIDVAKEILTRLVDSLRSNPNLELALRVYGHRYPRQSNNCQDTKLEVPFAIKNHDAIINKLKEIVPKGVTPITYSLEQAANDFPSAQGYRNIVILITDGIESCGGDPCSTSKALQSKGVFLRPFIIGLGLEGGKILDCAGKYFDSENSTAFNNVLNQTIKTTFSKTSVSVELLDEYNRPTETNVAISFLNDMTNTPAYEFVHYLNSEGKPDSVNIDPVLSYTVVVNTVPQIVRRNVNIENGRHNVISIPAPQGNLVIKQEGRKSGFSIIVREKGSATILNTQVANETFRYLKGTYEIETLTLPRRTFDITINPGQTRTVTLPTPGLVNINTISSGYGSLFEVLADGTEKWVCNLEDKKSQHTYTLLPGTYKIAFRVGDAGGSKYTAVKTFQLNSGQTMNVSVFN
ncbi:MAG TPA: VWA domain-containing protein [Cyclobacteriaceae bacterium]|nr:VWA domain-containing protein [Cyclobacteriaceae bacterium]